jgi:hypothetical protein
MNRIALLAALVLVLSAIGAAAGRAGLRTSATITSLVVRDVTLIDGSGGTWGPSTRTRDQGLQ